MGIRAIFITAALSSAVLLNAQSKSEIKEIWREAESHYLYGEFELANPLYLMLNDLMPGNANIKYKIANCYLNIYDEKAKAIPFLEEAVKNTSYNSKSGKLSETKAPLDVYFSLGNAYRIANRLDSAVMTYELFKKLIKETGEMTNEEFIDQQIKACELAKDQIKNPVNVSITPLEDYINLGSVNDRPVISFDGSTMAYTEYRGLERIIYVSRKKDGKWSSPREINREAGTGYDCHTTSLNKDGTELYLFKNDNFDGNIYVTRYAGGTWSPVEKLNHNINTRYYESHASVSADGQRLYFTSNREGGQGGLDIWVAVKDETGDWGIPVNMGATVNTPFHEESPFISEDGKTLTFSSEGHGSMGGYDIYTTTISSGAWSSPVNIGYPLSTTDDDIAFQPYYGGTMGLYSLLTDYKKKEICEVIFNPVDLAVDSVMKDTVMISFDPDSLPYITITDSSMVVTNMVVRDVSDSDQETDPDVLYYTVQVMALYNPVDPAYFEHADITIFYNRDDRFFRYTTGKFDTKLKAYQELSRLLRLGYPSDIFVKKVYRNDTPR